MTTTNYSWTLPTVGASVNTWGTLVNNILIDIDANMFARTGGTISGNVAVAGGVSATGNVTAGNGAALRAYRPDGVTYAEITHGSSGTGNIYNDPNSDGHVFRLGGVDKMTLDASGNLLVGTTTSSGRLSTKASGTSTYAAIFFDSTNAFVSGFYVGSSGITSGYGGADCVQWIAKDATTSRSINLGGTINAAGTDYAEYERNNGAKLAKGQVIGFKQDGTLTDVYADAIRFGVKSTNPGLVGGDAWGTDKQVGNRPGEPQFKAPEYKGPQNPGEEPIEPVRQNLSDDASDKASEDFASTHAAWATASADHEKLAYVYRVAQQDHEAQVEIAKHIFDTETYPEYQRALAEFEARLETERQTVDRIAYCGKVPVAVYGATPGGYIIADKDSKGKIIGKFVADPDFAQYKKAVGRVNRIMDAEASAHLAEAINSKDESQFGGMAEIAVIVH